MISYFTKLEALESLEHKGQKIYKVLDVKTADSGCIGSDDGYLEVNPSIGDIVMGRARYPDYITYIVGNDLNEATHKSIYWFPKGLDDLEVVLKEIAYQEAIRKMADMFGNNNNLMIFNMFRYLTLLSKFAEYGIFINDRNREEQYIEIINKENPELINHLQEYLDLRDYIEGAMHHYGEFAKVLTNSEY